MSKSKQWKQIERDWANVYLPRRDEDVVERLPVTGRHSGDVPDIEHPYFAVEVKYGKVVSSRTLKAVEQAYKSSLATRRLPLVCQSHRTEGKRDLKHLITMDLDTFTELAECYMKHNDPYIDTSKNLNI